MNAPHSLLAGMTRIEMLIALYDRAIYHVEQMEKRQRSGDTPAARFHEWKALKLVAGLHAGVVPDGSELTSNLVRLFEFCHHELSASRPAPALRVLEMLRDGWAAIREQANLEEAEGRLPALQPVEAGVAILA